MFSISLIKKLTEEWESNNCCILLKYKINNAKECLPLRIVQINSFVTYLTVIFKKVPVLVMSSSNTKDTPKKVYPKSATSNTCRLCRSIYETKYLKNLYNKANFQLLVMAETIYGCKIPCVDGLPRLICRPCERRLQNFTSFRKLICDSQTAFSRSKRCIDISPSVTASAPKSARRDLTSSAKTSSRRGLSFQSSSPLKENFAVPMVNDFINTFRAANVC